MFGKCLRLSYERSYSWMEYSYSLIHLQLNSEVQQCYIIVEFYGIILGLH